MPEMPRLLITTVGTSLLTNRDDRPWAGWNGHAGDSLPDVALVDRWLTESDPIKVSAETNTLQAIDVRDTDHVRFLHSDTPEGRFCSERLQRFYSIVVRCRQVDGRSLTALGYSYASFSQKGLKILVDEAIKAVRHARKKSLESVFCATGGFKAEIAFLNLIGALLEVEVYYIHEQFREIVRLPRLPLAWDADWVLQRRNFFEWVDEEPRRKSEVESWLNAYPELLPLVEEAPDGYSYLNAAGDLLFSVAKEVGPRTVWPAAIAKPPDEKNGLSGVEHHRPQGWRTFVNRLSQIDCVSRISYDEAAYGGKAVKILDSSQGVLAVRYDKTGEKLPLRVETSAHGSTQTEMVKDFVVNKIMGK